MRAYYTKIFFNKQIFFKLFNTYLYTMKKAVKYIVVVVLIIISYQYGKGWEKAETERKAIDYINNDCTEAEKIAIEIVIFGEVQN